MVKSFWLVGIFFLSLGLSAQSIVYDTVIVPQNYLLLLKDSVLIFPTDTVLYLPQGQAYKLKYNSDVKTQQFYDSLHVKSKQKRWKKELYNLLVTYRKAQDFDSADNVKPEVVFFPYQGLTIQKIIVVNVDVLVGVVTDTSVTANSGIAKLLNSTHIDTREKVIRKNLIIKEGQTIDANRMADNERIIRSLNYIEDAKLVVLKIDDQNANVLIITKDIYPLSFGFGFSSINKFNLDLRHRNVLGMGQSIRYRALYNTDYLPSIGSRLDYSLSNLAKTNIEFYSRLLTTPFVDEYKFGLHKQYLSPETKYAGGFEFQYLRDHHNLDYEDTSISYSFKRDIENFWLGRSILLSKQNRQNLLIAGKFYRTKYLDGPEVNIDTNQFFSSSTLVLGNVIFIKQRNIRTRFLQYFGKTEDVHVGYLMSLTSGYAWTDYGNFPYAGLRLGYGHAFTRGGYLGLRAEYGSYFYEEKQLQGVLDLNIKAYSRLLQVGRSSMRIGGGLIYKEGLNRFDYEWISLGDEIAGLSNKDTRAKSKAVFSMEAVYFSFVNFYGFRFAPYFSADVGLIGSKNPLVYSGKLHLGVGAGVRIRNESLVIKTIELAFVYYPYNATGSDQYSFVSRTSEQELVDKLNVDEPYIVKF